MAFSIGERTGPPPTANTLWPPLAQLGLCPAVIPEPGNSGIVKKQGELIAAGRVRLAPRTGWKFHLSSRFSGPRPGSLSHSTGQLPSWSLTHRAVQCSSRFVCPASHHRCTFLFSSSLFALEKVTVVP